MKRLNLFTGFHKYTLADLEHAQEAREELMSGLGLAFTDDAINNKSFILWGCEEWINPSPFMRHIDEGYVFLNGELYYVPPFAQAINGGVAILEIDSTYRADNPIIYGSGAKDVHEIRIAKPDVVPGGSIPAGAYVLGWMPDASALLLNKMKVKSGSDIAWRYVGDIGNPAQNTDYPNHSSNTSTDQNVRFRKDISGQVTITGIIDLDHWTTVGATPGNTTENLFFLPAGYRPDNEIVRTTMHIEANGYGILISVRVDAGGGVFLEQPVQTYPTGFGSGQWANVAAKINLTFMVKD